MVCWTGAAVVVDVVRSWFNGMERWGGFFRAGRLDFDGRGRKLPKKVDQMTLGGLCWVKCE